VPGYKDCYLAILRRFHDKGVEDVNGHLLYRMSNTEYDAAYGWLREVGLLSYIDGKIEALEDNKVCLDILPHERILP
jgi:isocitrate lyase